KISPQSLGILVKAKNAMLIDLRDAKDFREGHISGSRNIPYSQITKHVEELKASDRPLVFICRSEERRVGKECRSGWRTHLSSRRRHTRFSRDWSSDVCSSDLKISPQSLGILVKAKNAMLIDLRDAKDFREGHISGSRNIPYSQITKHVEELKASDRPLVFIC